MCLNSPAQVTTSASFTESVASSELIVNPAIVAPDNSAELIVAPAITVTPAPDPDALAKAIKDAGLGDMVVDLGPNVSNNLSWTSSNE